MGLRNPPFPLSSSVLNFCPPPLICLFLIPKRNAENLNGSAPVLNLKTDPRHIRTLPERIQ